METVNQEVTEKTAEQRTFTQDELNAVVEERLKREKAKYSDYDALKEKAGKLDALEEAQKSELQKANDKASALASELETLKKQNEVREIREKVARETGVPVNLLTGDTEEACTEQAKAISEYAKPGAYPNVKDGGEARSTGKQSTREQFEEWAQSAFS